MHLGSLSPSRSLPAVRLVVPVLLALCCFDACSAPDADGNPGDDERPTTLDDGGAHNAVLLAEGEYVIHTGQSDAKCLDIAASSTADGAPVQQWTCNGTKAQRYRVHPAGDGFVWFENAGSGKALDVTKSSPDVGAPVQQWAYAATPNQQFALFDGKDGLVGIRARHSQKVLQVAGRSIDEGARLVQSEDAGKENQRFRFELKPPTTTVVGFDKSPMHFGGGEDKRTIETKAAFPATGTFQKINLRLTLGCPSGRCDAWDRFGTLGVLLPGSDAAVELARFMTPYGVGGTWDIDVTDLRPLLTGDVKLRAFIDTWVGPGHAQGNGWLLTTTFTLEGGTPAREAVAVTPLWTRTDAAYGAPEPPVRDALGKVTVTPPQGTAFAVRTFVTGHGQGNAENCAEFCVRDHTLEVAGKAFTARVWRDDCATSTVPNQAGNVRSPRAGWCPGADVHPWIVDVTSSVRAGQATDFTYDVPTYENTCHPEAETCGACYFRTTCAFDGGLHTPPFFSVSSVLITYR